MDKKKLVKITAVFFACMLCFTVLSRAADQMSVAVVSTSRPENRMITHEVKASGRIVQNQELAVTTEPNQRVKTLYVSEGDRVKKGELLFEVDMTVLEEQILEQKQEMEKQQLTVSDAKSQKDVSAQQKASQQAQAAEQYSLSTHSAGVRLSRAKKALSEAKKELEDFRKQQGMEPEENGVEASLEQACEEKAELYIQAEQELSQVQWKIEQAVYTALQNAQGRALLVPQENTYTQSAEEAELLEEPDMSASAGTLQEAATLETVQPDIQPQTDAMEPAMPETDAPETLLPETDIPDSQPQPDTPEIPLPDANVPGDIIIEDITEVPGDGIPNGNGDGTDGNSAAGNSGIDGMQTPGTQGGTSGETGSAPVTQEELDRIEQSVRSQYSGELSAAKQKTELALANKKAAEDALIAYQQERMEAAGAQNAQSEKQLIANVTAAQQAYEDAAIAANEAAVTSGRAVQQAGIPDPQNSTDRMNEITYEQMELQLEKLEQLKQNGGKVKAPSDGLITKITIMTGEKTTDTTALLMADLSKGYRFTAELTKEQEEYIGTGDLVTLQGKSKKQKLEELPVEAVTADEEDETLYHVTVQIPEDSELFELGAGATLMFSQKSEAYPVCVPISALRMDEKNQTYVLVTEQYESVLGTEMRARRVSVTVLEKNESYAALAEGGVTSQQEVIISSDKAVDEGSRVRVQEG